MADYAGSKAKAGRGSSLSIGGISGVGGGFTLLGEVMTTGFSGGAWSTADTTNLQSGADEEFITTTRNNGEVPVDGNLIDGDAGQALLNAAYDSGLKYDFKMQMSLTPGQSTPTVYTFSALVISFFDFKVGVKDVVSFSGKLKVSGAIAKVLGS